LPLTVSPSNSHDSGTTNSGSEEFSSVALIAVV